MAVVVLITGMYKYYSSIREGTLRNWMSDGHVSEAPADAALKSQDHVTDPYARSLCDHVQRQSNFLFPLEGAQYNSGDVIANAALRGC